MKRLPKVLIALLFFLLATIKLSGQTWAYVSTSASSATLANQNGGIEKPDERIGKLSLFLASYNSPLENYAADFISIADKYNVDWRLVPAISGVESTFGHNIPTGSYNAYGWNNGNYYFKDWPNSIDIVTKTLKEKYIDRGADTVWKIAPIYAPPSQTWGAKVNYFMDKIEKFDSQSTQPSELELSL